MIIHPGLVQDSTRCLRWLAREVDARVPHALTKGCLSFAGLLDASGDKYWRGAFSSAALLLFMTFQKMLLSDSG